MTHDHDESRALLGLMLCKGISNVSAFALIEHFGSAQAALGAGTAALREVEGIGPATVAGLRERAGQAAVERELELMERFRTRLVPFFADDYPPALRHLERDAPALLRVRGECRREDCLALGVVGSRRCSTYGRQQARRLSADLASMGFTIVSGMAAGIDSEAHRGAIAAKGRTVAVLGCGLATALCGRDAELALEIAESGAVLSELPMETPPRPGNFPPRNRLIAGLSLGVVVVEAAARSGSLITARLAGEQGKAVFAVPGNVDSPTSRGAHALIRDGTVLVESARDVVDGLGPLSEPVELPAPSEAAEAESVDDPRVLALNERERGILALVGRSPMHIDEVVAQTELPPSIVSSTLLTLEVRGLIQQVAGQRYVRR